MAYKCRDCASIVKTLPDKPTNECGYCGSLYLLPEKSTIKIKKKQFEVTISDRLLSLFFGIFVGSITFFIWGVIIMFGGGVSAGKGSMVMFYSGIHFSIYFAAALGLTGFILGSDKLINIFGILWGTDKEFLQKFDDGIFSLISNIPPWIGYTLLTIIIVGTYSYILILMQSG